MGSKRTHLAHGTGKPVCEVPSEHPLLTSDPAAITCKNCLNATAPLGPYVSQFFSKVAGVSYRNEDGSSRQSIIRRCHIGERLLLKPEPDNPVDPNAVRVLRQNGELSTSLQKFANVSKTAG